jgi:hypothetical protein
MLLFFFCIQSCILIKVSSPLLIYKRYRFRDDADFQPDLENDVNPCGHSVMELRIPFGMMRDPDAENVGPCPKCWLPESSLNLMDITTCRNETPGVVFEWMALTPDDEQPPPAAGGPIRWRTFSARAHGEVSVASGAELPERAKVRVVEMAREGGTVRILSCSVRFLPTDRPIRLARGTGELDPNEYSTADEIRAALWSNRIAFQRDERYGYPSVRLGFTAQEEAWLLARKTTQLALNRADANGQDRVPADAGSAHVLDGLLQPGHMERPGVVHDSGRHPAEGISGAGPQEFTRKPEDGDADRQVPRQTNIGQYFSSVYLGRESGSGSTGVVERRKQQAALRPRVLRVVSRKRGRGDASVDRGSTLHRFFGSEHPVRDVKRESEHDRDPSEYKRQRY